LIRRISFLFLSFFILALAAKLLYHHPRQRRKREGKGGGDRTWLLIGIDVRYTQTEESKRRLKVLLSSWLCSLDLILFHQLLLLLPGAAPMKSGCTLRQRQLWTILDKSTRDECFSTLFRSHRQTNEFNRFCRGGKGKYCVATVWWMAARRF
jgi:hypothetical protein